MPGPKFDENGEVWGRLELKVGGEWVTVRYVYLGDEEAEVGCRQLGNELGYSLVSWSVVHYDDTPMGSGKQYNVRECQGNEDELSSCDRFEEGGVFIHTEDIGLRCSFAIAGDECEECPPGKYRYACTRVCRQEGMIKIGLQDATVPPSSQAASYSTPSSFPPHQLSPNPPLNPLLFQL